jgi:hypothetical protein
MTGERGWKVEREEKREREFLSTCENCFEVRKSHL